MKTRRQRGGWPWSRKKVHPVKTYKNSSTSMNGFENFKGMKQYTKINVEANEFGFNKEKSNANKAKAAAKAAANANAKAATATRKVYKTPKANWGFRFSPR